MVPICKKKSHLMVVEVKKKQILYVCTIRLCYLKPVHAYVQNPHGVDREA